MYHLITSVYTSAHFSLGTMLNNFKLEALCWCLWRHLLVLETSRSCLVKWKREVLRSYIIDVAVLSYNTYTSAKAFSVRVGLPQVCTTSKSNWHCPHNLATWLHQYRRYLPAMNAPQYCPSVSSLRFSPAHPFRCHTMIATLRLLNCC